MTARKHPIRPGPTIHVGEEYRHIRDLQPIPGGYDRPHVVVLALNRGSALVVYVGGGTVQRVALDDLEALP